MPDHDAWNWKALRQASAFLALEDGTLLHGRSVGAPVDRVGEVVFNTGMSGYQEILSDPSYAGQLVVLTHPEIGNTGMNDADMESSRLFAEGLLTHACNPPSNWRSRESLAAMLVREGIPALAGLDTRALTLRLRERGTLKAVLAASGRLSEPEALARARAWEGLDGQDYAARVSCEQPYEWDPDGMRTCSWGMAESLPPAEWRIVAYDFGIKWNILRSLRRLGFAVTVVPARHPAGAVLDLNPDGVFLSNGPADPSALGYAVESVRTLLDRGLPLMGICLGHQLLGLALGAETERLKFGHHGCNHPVRNVATGRVEITSQNHNYAVRAATLDPRQAEISHLNLNDHTVEGIRVLDRPAFSVQYHPEACPGPHDAFYLFERFRDLIRSSR